MPDITIRDYLKNARFVREQYPEVVIDSIMKNKDKIIEMNQEQLYDGKDIFGNDIRPLYTEDTFFKTEAQAKGYVKWKQKITPNSKRNPNAPNLFINGYFYRGIDVVRSGVSVFLRSINAGTLGAELSTKYKNTMGLNEKNQAILSNIIYPEIMNFVKRYL